MQIHTGKIKEVKLQSAANAVSNNKGNSNPAFQFVDNRPRTTQLKEILELTKNSPRTQKPVQYQKQANSSTGGQIMQMMKIGETSYKNTNELLKNCYMDEGEKLEIRDLAKDTITGEIIRQEIMGSQKFNSVQDFLTHVKSKVTNDRNKAAVATGSQSSGSLNVHEGPVAGIKSRDNGMEAGSGQNWHVHHDHAKCGNGPRINFHGRTKEEILALIQKAANNGEGYNKERKRDYEAVIEWVNKHK